MNIGNGMRLDHYQQLIAGGVSREAILGKHGLGYIAPSASERQDAYRLDGRASETDPRHARR